jgi:hypothetical protein
MPSVQVKTFGAGLLDCFQNRRSPCRVGTIDSFLDSHCNKIYIYRCLGNVRRLIPNILERTERIDLVRWCCCDELELPWSRLWLTWPRSLFPSFRYVELRLITLIACLKFRIRRNSLCHMERNNSVIFSALRQGDHIEILTTYAAPLKISLRCSLKLLKKMNDSSLQSK